MSKLSPRALMMRLKLEEFNGNGKYNYIEKCLTSLSYMSHFNCFRLIIISRGSAWNNQNVATHFDKMNEFNRTLMYLLKQTETRVRLKTVGSNVQAESEVNSKNRQYRPKDNNFQQRM